MPPRMFEDLVVSRLARPGHERVRVLPVSLLFHGLAVAALIVLPTLSADLPPVQAGIFVEPVVWRAPVVAVATPPSPPMPVSERRATSSPTPRLEQAAPVAASGAGPAVTSDLSKLGVGEIDPDAPPLCLAGCGDTTGAILPGPPRLGGGEDTAPAIRRAGHDIVAPLKISGDRPAYPEIARVGRIQGDVVIECTIAPSGSVVNAVVVKSHPLFDASALAAVRTWRYRPSLVEGVPVPVLMTVTVRFRIN